jgi:hypothetical protein
MRVVFLCLGIVTVSLGCAQRTYEIDFSQVEGFEWNGKLRLTKSEHGTLGPLLTIQKYWTVDHIELVSRDGRVASIERDGYRDIPVATVGPNAPPGGIQLLGTTTFWQGSNTVVIFDPDMMSGFPDRATTQPAPGLTLGKSTVRLVPDELRPYAEHAADLKPVDWWAIASNEATEVSIECRIPDEGLIITMRGDPHKYGPAVLEVRTEDGRLLKRIERQQVPVKEIEPEPSPTEPGPSIRPNGDESQVPE